MGDLLKQMSQQISTLISHEAELAKAELRQKGKAAGLGAGMFGGAGALTFYAVGALTAAAILGLATTVDGWLAALIVGGAYLVVAGLLALRGRSKVAEASPPVPEQAIETTKADVQETKERLQEARR
jgi:membrane protein